MNEIKRLILIQMKIEKARALLETTEFISGINEEQKVTTV